MRLFGLGKGGSTRKLASDFNLTTLAALHRSDKGSTGTLPHNYTLLYDMLLGPRRDSVTRMLEIGLLVGGPEVGADADRATGDLPSVRMWLDYFPNATVHGFDISDFSFFSHPRFRFTRGDSGVAADLGRVTAQGERFDFIIDDGSHASFHQQLAFQTLFPHLEPGGIYIIEDLHWQSPAYEGSLPPTIRTVELIDAWFQTGAFPKVEAAELAGLPALADQINFAFLVNQPFTGDQRLPKVAVIQKKF
ncbi:MAG: class I SAM-dependent methyltransferase [Rhizorhabdus sp.]